RRKRGKAQFPQQEIGPIHVGGKSLLKLEVHAQAHGDIVSVFDPMWRVYGDMNGPARGKIVDSRPILLGWFVESATIVYSPKAFNLLLWQDLTIILPEDANALFSLHLQKEITFAVDVIRGDAVG